MEKDPILVHHHHQQQQNNTTTNNNGNSSNSSSSSTSTGGSTTNQSEDKNRVRIMSSVQEEITTGRGAQRSQGKEQREEEIVVHPDLENNDFLDFRCRKKHLEPLHIEKWTVETEHKAEKEWRQNVYRMVCVALSVFIFLLAVGLIWDFAVRGNKSSQEEPVLPVLLCTYPMPGDSCEWIRPLAYDVTIFLRSQQFQREFNANTFDGKVAIQLEVQEDTRCVALDSSNLTYTSVSIQLQDEIVCLCGPYPTCQQTDCQTRQSVNTTVNVRKQLGIAIFDLGDQYGFRKDVEQFLIIEYKGQFHDGKGQGLYRSGEYRNMDGVKESLIVTQDTRYTSKLMPCFQDEKYKATFSVSVVVEDRKDLSVFSNMKLLSTSEYDNNLGFKYDFQTTPLMSPYLLAIAVGQFDTIIASSSSGKNITVGTAYNRSLSLSSDGLQRQSMLDIPLQFALRALEFYEDWTDFEQPLEKFDLIAVPGKTFSMENWGLLLFDELRFLVDPQYSGMYIRWRSADIICHEMAHQWFGNLVSVNSRKELVLAEGIASYLENKCVSYVQQLPQVTEKIMQMYIPNPAWELSGAHEGPRRNALRVLGDPFQGPLWPLDDDYSSVSFYSGGAAILAMLEQVLEQDKQNSLQDALREVLLTFQYSTVGVIDFIQVLQPYFERMLNSTENSNFDTDNNSTGSLNQYGSWLISWFGNSGLPQVTFKSLQPTSVSNNEQDQQIQISNIYQSKKCSFGVVQDSVSILSCDSVYNNRNYEDSDSYGLYQSPPMPTWWVPLNMGSFLTSSSIPNSNSLDDNLNYERNLNLVGPQMDISSPISLESNSNYGTLFPRGPKSAGLFYGIYEAEYITSQLLKLESVDIFNGDCSPGDFSSQQINQLVQVGQFLLDLHFAAFSPFPEVDAQWNGVLKAMEVVGKSSNLTCTGIGTYVTMVPLIDSIIQFELYLNGNSECLNNFRDWVLVNLLNPIFSSFQNQIAFDQSPFESSNQDAKFFEYDDDIFGMLIRPFLTYTAFRLDLKNTQVRNDMLNAYKQCEIDQQCDLNPNYAQSVYMMTIREQSQQYWHSFLVQWRNSKKSAVTLAKGHRLLMGMTQSQGQELADLLKEVLGFGIGDSLFQRDSDSAWILAARNQPELVLETLKGLSKQQANLIPLEEVLKILVTTSQQQQQVERVLRNWELSYSKMLKLRSIMSSKLRWLRNNQLDVCNYVSS